MARTPETPIPVTNSYRERLTDLIAELGRNRVAELAGVDPSTLHRNVNEGNLTYTTAMKIRDAIIQGWAEDRPGERMDFLPPPWVPVLSQSHYDLCDIARELHEIDDERFAKLLEHAVELRGEAKRDQVMEAAKHSIAHPLRKPSKDDDRGG